MSDHDNQEGGDDMEDNQEREIRSEPEGATTAPETGDSTPAPETPNPEPASE